MALQIGKGQSHPLGATPSADGVGFSVFSKSCEALELLLFDKVDDSRPSDVIRLDPRQNKTYHYWHIFVGGLKPGQIYGYRALGPFKPDQGLRFDSDKVLLDPYGRSVAVPASYSRAAACRLGDNTAFAMKSVVADLGAYDWEGDAPLKRPFSVTVIYEMHVAGFTRHQSSGVAPEKKGHVCRTNRKNPLFAGFGHHGCRIAAGF
jgi:isoamylase